MNATETLAIAKAIATKVETAARSQVEQGAYEVDLMVRITGNLTVGADTTYTPTTSVPLLPTLALFIRYSGVTGPLALQALQRAMREALEAQVQGVDTAETIREIADIAAAEAAVAATMAALPAKARKGAVKFSGSVEIAA